MSFRQGFITARPANSAGRQKVEMMRLRSSNFTSPSIHDTWTSLRCSFFLESQRIMAHRIITQVVITGTRVLGRAFAEAYKQASATSQYTRAQAKSGNPGGVSAFASNGLTLEEACKILNVKPPQNGKANMEEVLGRFKRLFDVNDPKNGGSFYLQSKVLRARERIESEVRVKEEMAGREAEKQEGWKPKVYKDR